MKKPISHEDCVLWFVATLGIILGTAFVIFTIGCMYVAFLDIWRIR